MGVLNKLHHLSIITIPLIIKLAAKYQVLQLYGFGGKNRRTVCALIPYESFVHLNTLLILINDSYQKLCGLVYFIYLKTGPLMLLIITLVCLQAEKSYKHHKNCQLLPKQHHTHISIITFIRFYPKA